MKAVHRMVGLTLAAILTTPTYAELELRLTFEDPLNPAVDVSGKDRPVELIPEGGAFLDEIIWVEDAEHGGVLQYPGDNNGWVYAEIPNLPGEAFTVMLWAYRDPDSCCLGGGANDGLFQVTSDGDPELGPPTGQKIIGGWIQKSDGAVWGRVIPDTGENISLDQGTEFMEDETWTHFAYRGLDGEFQVFIDGEDIGPVLEWDGTLSEHDSIFVGKQGTETWGGMLDDLRVYSSALTQDDIKAAMADFGAGGGVVGDFNGNGALDTGDMDLLTAEVAGGMNTGSFDLDGDAVVNDADRVFWIESLVNSYVGDSNLDGEFNSGDLVAVFSGGQYEDAVAGNSGWGDGDWSGDGDFDSGDFVTAFSAGGYEKGPRVAPAAVPEPSSAALLMLAMTGLLQFFRRSR